MLDRGVCPCWERAVRSRGGKTGWGGVRLASTDHRRPEAWSRSGIACVSGMDSPPPERDASKWTKTEARRATAPEKQVSSRRTDGLQEKKMWCLFRPVQALPSTHTKRSVSNVPQSFPPPPFLRRRCRPVSGVQASACSGRGMFPVPSAKRFAYRERGTDSPGHTLGHLPSSRLLSAGENQWYSVSRTGWTRRVLSVLLSLSLSFLYLSLQSKEA